MTEEHHELALPIPSGLTQQDVGLMLYEVKETLKLKVRKRQLDVESLRNTDFAIRTVPFVGNQWDVDVNLLPHGAMVRTYRVFKREDDQFEVVAQTIYERI